MNIFNMNPARRAQKNVFNLSHERKFSMNMGELVPILSEDIIPGDKWQLNTECLIRLAPMLAPIMHQVNVYTHFFFVPYRLIWDEFKDFITGGEDGTAEPMHPYIAMGSANEERLYEGTLADYLGVSTVQPSQYIDTKFNALPFRAYQAIYNDYYRDQNLQDKIDFNKTSGNGLDNDKIMTLRTRAWEKDYFTSALPWTQKGGEVQMPISGSAPVEYNDDYTAVPKTVLAGSGDPNTGDTYMSSQGNTGVFGDSGGNPYAYDPDGSLEADLTQATSSSIEEVRRASRLQEWLERNARGGSRYIEVIKKHFGMQSSDSRLQRPEYLGGGKSPVVISEVLNSIGQVDDTGTTVGAPQGDMAGHGISAGNTHQFRKEFEEHGQLIGIMSVMPKTGYHQGTRKQFLKEDKFEYYWPDFANLGEQAIDTRELYDPQGDWQTEKTFGYTERYAEYKYIPSTVHGDFKSSLQHWHMARSFGSEPALNENFVTGGITDRIWAVQDDGETPKLYCQVYNNIKAIRPMPVFANPTL